MSDQTKIPRFLTVEQLLNAAMGRHRSDMTDASDMPWFGIGYRQGYAAAIRRKTRTKTKGQKL